MCCLSFQGWVNRVRDCMSRAPSHFQYLLLGKTFGRVFLRTACRALRPEDGVLCFTEIW